MFVRFASLCSSKEREIEQELCSIKEREIRQELRLTKNMNIFFFITIFLDSVPKGTIKLLGQGTKNPAELVIAYL